MRQYDPNLPLIFIHIPKTAGTSVREIFEGWFGSGLYRHYFDEEADKLPAKHDLPLLHSIERPVVVYGHFNSLRGFGVEDYYPEVRQFITILRDPFEKVISSYYYIRKFGGEWKDQSRVPKSDIREYLLKTPPNTLNHFPRKVTKDNYRALIDEFFIEVGVMEYLVPSMQRIAKEISREFDSRLLQHQNVTVRDQPNPKDLRDEYVERYPLEFEVFEYALSRYKKHGMQLIAQQANQLVNSVASVLRK